MTELKRTVGLGGAILLGLGSILGTGVFVSIGIAEGIAGPAVIYAVIIGGLVAACNGLSSAQLAAAHPVSGGTYEYGYEYLNPTLGFTAGWMFLLAKSASAATAALGFSRYLLDWNGDTLDSLLPYALVAVCLLTILVAGGVSRSNRANAIIVSITIGVLLYYIRFGADNLESPCRILPEGFDFSLSNLSLRDLLNASALMFVAYTGYGRIATLGEEVRNPRKTIPRAIITTLLVSMLLYVGVARVLVNTEHFTWLQKTATSELVITVGAITAMLGVLLNLLLGLSRVLLAMGRRGDFPAYFGVVREKGATPVRAVYMMGAVIGGLVLIGDVKTTWSFSAFTVLIYYAITNLAALRLPEEKVLYPRIVSVLGLVSCGFLAFWVEPKTWMVGLALIALGLSWKKYRDCRSAC